MSWHWTLMVTTFREHEWTAGRCQTAAVLHGSRRHKAASNRTALDALLAEPPTAQYESALDDGRRYTATAIK